LRAVEPYNELKKIKESRPNILEIVMKSIEMYGVSITYPLDFERKMKEFESLLSADDDYLNRVIKDYRRDIEPLVLYHFLGKDIDFVKKLQTYSREILFKLLFPNEEYDKSYNRMGGQEFDLAMMSKLGGMKPMNENIIDHFNKEILRAEETARRRLVEEIKRKRDLYSRLMDSYKNSDIGFGRIVSYARSLPGMDIESTLEKGLEPGDELIIYFGGTNQVLNYAMSRISIKENSKADFMTSVIGEDGIKMYETQKEDAVKNLIKNIPIAERQKMRLNENKILFDRMGMHYLVYIYRRNDGKSFCLGV